jgi:hypothetical protein
MRVTKELSASLDYFRLMFVFLRADSAGLVFRKSPYPCSLPHIRVLSFSCLDDCGFEPNQGAITMEWVTPQHEEIDLNCEVSSYANAEL